VENTPLAPQRIGQIVRICGLHKKIYQPNNGDFWEKHTKDLRARRKKTGLALPGLSGKEQERGGE
jgi:hypothetical protein